MSIKNICLTTALICYATITVSQNGTFYNNNLALIPDGTGNPLQSTINVTGFPGEQISQPDDLSFISIKMEHSYIGDLELALECPNGTQVTLFDSYSPGFIPGGFNGGNLFIGNPWEGAFQSNGPGVGSEYIFSTSYNSWGDMSNEVSMNNTVPATLSTGSSMNPNGIYLSEESFSSLIGCPVDGQWSIIVQDNISIDDGYIFEWGFELDVSFSNNVYGKIYNDLNESCTLETGEPGLTGIPVLISPGGIIAQVNNAGMWYIDSLPIGTYTATIDTTNLNWTPTCPVSQSFTVTDPQAYTPGPDFGMVNNTPCSSPKISIHAPLLRRCFTDQVVYVQACNDITATGALDSAYADVELDSLLTPTSSSIPYTSLGNDVYRFQLGNINPGQCVDFTINTTVSCDAVLDQTLCMDAKLYPVDSCALDSIPTNPLPPTYGNDPNLVMPQPCTLPWDNSSLEVEGWCQGDSVQFSITNTGDPGNGDMDCYSPVLLYVNDTLVNIDSVQLQGQETIYYSYPANGETWILAVEQHPLHPGNSHPNAHLELCGSDSTQWIPDMINNQPLDDADPVDDIYCGIVTGSYDPNDKRGFPTGVTSQHHVQPNQQLQYVIRFQNTGTDTAFTVVIRDTLDTDLNIFTVTSGVSSHDYTFRKYGPRVLEWTFDDIMLPDSTTDEPGSNGFVTFTVDQVPNLPNGTVINNQADIYFDYNAPIITNETDHLIMDMIESDPLDLGVKEFMSLKGNSITVYPNPNNGLLFIELEEYSQPVNYKVSNINGRIISSGRLMQEKNAIDLQGLSSGLYFIQVDKSEPVKVIKK